MASPVMNADFTNASVNGHGAQVLILASPTENVALYIGREKKGHKGIEGTPLEAYVGTAVHDHDKTFYHYGTRHQECNILLVDASVIRQDGKQQDPLEARKKKAAAQA